MKYAKVINPLLRLLGYIELPKKDEVLNFPMLSFFISKDDNEEFYNIFLNKIIKIIVQKYKMFIIGTSKNYFVNDIYKNLKNIHFDSKIYEIDLLYRKGRKQQINKNTVWLECGLL